MNKSKPGVFIKELRIKEGYSQKELASLLNVAQNTVSQYENGIREPDNETLVKLSEIFNVSTDYLLGRTNKKHLLIK